MKNMDDKINFIHLKVNVHSFKISDIIQGFYFGWYSLWRRITHIPLKWRECNTMASRVGCIVPNKNFDIIPMSLKQFIDFIYIDLS